MVVSCQATVFPAESTLSIVSTLSIDLNSEGIFSCKHITLLCGTDSMMTRSNRSAAVLYIYSASRGTAIYALPRLHTVVLLYNADSIYIALCKDVI